MPRKRRVSPVLFLCLVCFFFIPDFLIQFFLLAYLLLNLTAFLLSLATRRMLRITRNFNISRLYRGEAVEVLVTIENRLFFTIHNLVVSDRHGELFIRGSASAIFSPGPRGEVTLAYTIVPERRGRYSLGPVDISGADPFSFFPWEISVEAPAELIVYPHVFGLDLPCTHGLPGGSIASSNPVYEDITSYRSMREYIPGDDLKRVNWKVSARLGNLFTMQYQPSLSFSSIILLNLIEGDYPLRYRHQAIEFSIQVAASLVYFCAANKQETGLACYTRHQNATVELNYQAGKGPAHAVGILEELACVASVSEKKVVTDLLYRGERKIPFACRLFYVGPPLSDAEIARLVALRGRGIFPEFFITVLSRGFGRRLADLGFARHDVDEIRIKHAAS